MASLELPKGGGNARKVQSGPDRQSDDDGDQEHESDEQDYNDCGDYGYYGDKRREVDRLLKL